MLRLLAIRQIRQLLKRLSQPGKVLRDPTLVFFILRARVAQQSDPGSDSGICSLRQITLRAVQLLFSIQHGNVDALVRGLNLRIRRL